MKRIIVSLFSAAVLLGGTASLAVAEKGAQQEKAGDRSIPAALDHHANNECDTSLVSIPDTGAWTQVPGMIVSVSNPFSTARDAYVNFTSETSSTSAATRLDIRYSLDSGSPFTVGAEFGFRRPVNTLQSMSTHTGVLHVPPGTHTIRPWVRVASGSGTGSGTLWFRCLHARVAGTTA